MPRIVLSADEKQAAREILHETWASVDLTQAAITRAAAPFGVNPREAYMTLLHLDTLDALSELDFLVFKGGTCVQTYLPPAYQRISVDLDFNSRHPHPNTVENHIHKLNVKLAEQGRAVTLQGIEYGKLLLLGHDERTGTVGFARYLPTPFDERASLRGTEFQARMVRVQINVKHHELPALDPQQRKIAFFTQPALQPKRAVKVETSSAADLVADKILTITKNVGGFGRERIKDFYDLFALGRLDIDDAKVCDKLDRIATRVHATRKAILDGAIERAEEVRANHAAAKGFVSSACKDGKALLDHWETQLDQLQGQLRALRA